MSHLHRIPDRLLERHRDEREQRHRANRLVRWLNDNGLRVSLLDLEQERARRRGRGAGA